MSDTDCKLVLFFFNDTATTEIYTLSLHDALPIFVIDEGEAAPPGQPPDREQLLGLDHRPGGIAGAVQDHRPGTRAHRSEEHTSELQSQSNLVCRLLLETKTVSSHTLPLTFFISTS